MQPPDLWMKLPGWKTTKESAIMLLRKQINMQHLFYECISLLFFWAHLSSDVYKQGVLSLQNGQFQLPRETEQGKKNNNYSLFSEEEVQPHVQCHSGTLKQNWEWVLNSKFTVQVLIAKLCFRIRYRLNLMSQILTVCSVWLSFLL